MNLPPIPEPDAVVDLLIRALDMRERETARHSKRVACHTVVLAKHFYSDPAVLTQVYWGALLHDLGKIGIPDSILLKHGALTADEWRVMRTHPTLGYDLIKSTPGLSIAADLVLHHEERFDGSGYPDGLVGDAISFPARLFAVIDTLDAMTADRPYRAAMTFDQAKETIVHESRSQFDPVAVDAFLSEETTLRRMVADQCGADMNMRDILGSDTVDRARYQPTLDSEQP